MFEEATDIEALHEWALRLLDSWPSAQGPRPYPLVAIGRALQHWSRVRELLSGDDEVLQVDLIAGLQLDQEDAEAMRYTLYMLSRCGVVARRTLKNRVRLRLQGETIDPAVLRESWTDAWACPGASFDLARPTYTDLDPSDHRTIANLLLFDGREVFEEAAAPEAVDELNSVEADLRLKMKPMKANESKGRRRARTWPQLERGTQQLFITLDRMGSFEDH